MNLYVWTIIDDNFYTGVAITALETNVESARSRALQALRRKYFNSEIDDEISALIRRIPAYAEDLMMINKWIAQEPTIYSIDEPMCTVMIYSE